MVTPYFVRSSRRNHNLANASRHTAYGVVNAEEEHYEQTNKFYSLLPAIYDYLYPDHLEYSTRLFEQLHPVLKDHGVTRVLDASCGVGHDIVCLAKYGYCADGLDASAAMVNEARNRLNVSGLGRAMLRVLDVREIRSSIPEHSYDMVMFRGNTLSNIQPQDLPAAIEAMVSIVRPGGLLLLDYRDGLEQLREAKHFEFRGSGYDHSHLTAFWSAYWLDHGKSLQDRYQVKAVLARASLREGISLMRYTIKSHYVDERFLSSVLTRTSIELSPLKLRHTGLPYLKTLLLRRASTT